MGSRLPVYQNGTVDDSYFQSRMRTVKRTLRNEPGYMKWWDEWGIDRYDERFVDHVNNLIKEQA